MGGGGFFQDNFVFCFSGFNLNLKYINWVIIFSTSCFQSQINQFFSNCYTCRACMCAAKGFSGLVNISSESCCTHADIYLRILLYPC